MMGRAAVIAGLVSLATLTAAGWLAWPRSTEDGPAPQMAAEIAEGRQLYAAYCASCHGADLEGQPDWQSPGPDGRLPAPPHDESGHTWHHGDALLIDYVRLGGRLALARRGVDFDSGMPGFEGQLDERQIRAILSYIKSTWPRQLQEVQAERTRAEQAGN